MTPKRFVAVTPDADRLPTFKIPIVDGSSPSFVIALECLARGDAVQAWANLESMSGSDQPRDGILLAKTLCCYARSDFDGALSHARDVAGLVGMTAWLALLMGVCHERGDRREDARQSYIAAFTLAVGGAPRPTASAHQSLVDLLCRLVVDGAPRPIDPVLRRIGWSLHAAGVLTTHRNILPAFAECLVRDVLPQALSSAIGEILSFLSLDRWTSTTELTPLLELFVVPLIRMLADRKRYRDALSVEAITFRLAIAKREDRDAFKELCRWMSPPLADAGRELARSIEPLPPPARKPHYGVAFVVHTIVSLAHVETLLDILTAIQARCDRRISCTLVGLSGENPSITDRCRASGIDVLIVDRLGAPGLALDQRLIVARRELALRGIGAVVWVTSAASASFVLALRLAPVQIFFAMKYHEFELPEIDAYLAGGSAGQRFGTLDGRQWRLAQSRYVGLYEPRLSMDAARVKASFGAGAIVLGCIGREAKINSSPFLDAVIAILRKNSNAVFLWTGRTQLPDVESRFERAGLAARCHFIGWVDTRLYAQVLDVFLDTFPFPCGVTALQAMAAATPVVLFDSPESRETGIPVFIQPLLSGDGGTAEQRARAAELMGIGSDFPHYLLATNTAQYIAHADALITNPSFRARAGAALKAFVDEFMTDEIACARSYERHIVEVIEGVASREQRL